MRDKLSKGGRRGGVLLIAGAMLGAFIAGPGNSIAQKVMGFTATTADKRYVKRGETLAAGKTDEGYRTIEVWEGEDAWKRFRRERLRDVSDDGGLLAEDAGFRDFTPEHVVVSAVLAEAKSTPRKESSA